MRGQGVGGLGWDARWWATKAWASDSVATKWVWTSLRPSSRMALVSNAKTMRSRRLAHRRRRLGFGRDGCGTARRSGVALRRSSCPRRRHRRCCHPPRLASRECGRTSPQKTIGTPTPVHDSHSEIMTDPQMRKLEEANIALALRQASGRIYGPRGAAQLLGLKPTTLASRMKRLGIS